MAAYFDNGVVQLYHADARDLPLSDASVHCIVTSPPYFGLRVYQDNDSWEGGAPDCAHTKASSTQGSTLEGGKKTTGHAQESYASDCPKCGAIHTHRGIGLEPSIEEYLKNLLAVFRECWRVLRDDGVMWVNIGDSYSGSWGNYNPGVEYQGQRTKETERWDRPAYGDTRFRSAASHWPQGNRLGIPERLALALQADGWTWRDTVIWAKKSAMPESVNGWRWEQCQVKVKKATQHQRDPQVKPSLPDPGNGIKAQSAEYQPCPGCAKCSPNDGLVLRKGSWRTTQAHEYIFMFTKGMGYYADGDTVKIAGSDNPVTTARNGRADKGYVGASGLFDTPQGQSGNGGYDRHPGVTANRRSVWNDISPEPYGGAHFATFPSDLPRICIQASTSERGCCPKCGSQWARVVERTAVQDHGRSEDARYTQMGGQYSRQLGGNYQKELQEHPTQTLGWCQTCEHDLPPAPATVLDPFAGTATTCLAAQRLGRRAVGVDLSEAYLKQAVKRLEGVPLPLSLG